jgi:hypothetical protein
LQKLFVTDEHRLELLYRIIIFAAILAGIVLRASKYLPAWSLRGDELAVTLNLVNRSAIDLLTKPLDLNQAAPMGFLLVVKGLITVFGSSEYILRLVGFLSGCASLVLMYKLLTKTSGPYGVVFSLLAFATSYYLIYYSSEVKQYSSDVFVTLVLALFFHPHIARDTNKRDFWELGIVGTLATFFSHPAIFVVIPIMLALLLHYWTDKQKLSWIMLMGVVWAGTFLAIYLILLRYQTISTYLITFWGDLNSYMPLRFWTDLGWFPKSIGHLFSMLSGLSSGISFLLIPLYLYGLWLFWKQGTWQWIIVSAFPIAINMIASGFEKFPFHGRVLLYLVPLVFIVFAKAMDGLTALVSNKFPAGLVFIVLVVVLLRPALATGSNFLVSKNYVTDDLKPVFAFMSENASSGDTVYLYHHADRQFEYYAPQYALERLNTVYGQDHSRNGREYLDELSSLPRGQRIWFLFTSDREVLVRKNDKRSEREYILSYLNDNGSLLNEFYSENNASSAHLYHLK